MLSSETSRHFPDRPWEANNLPSNLEGLADYVKSLRSAISKESQLGLRLNPFLSKDSYLASSSDINNCSDLLISLVLSLFGSCLLSMAVLYVALLYVAVLCGCPLCGCVKGMPGLTSALVRSE